MKNIMKIDKGVSLKKTISEEKNDSTRFSQKARGVAK